MIVRSIDSFSTNSSSITQERSRLMKLPEEIQRLILSYLSKDKLWGSPTSVNTFSKHFYKMISSKGFVLDLQNHYLASFYQTIQKVKPNNLEISFNTQISLEALELQMKEEGFKNPKASERQKLLDAIHLLSPGAFTFFLIYEYVQQASTLVVWSWRHAIMGWEDLINNKQIVPTFCNDLSLQTSNLLGIQPALSNDRLDHFLEEMRSLFSVQIDKNSLKNRRHDLIITPRYRYLSFHDKGKSLSLSKINSVIQNEILPLISEDQKTTVINFFYRYVINTSIATGSREDQIALREFSKLHIHKTHDTGLAHNFFNEIEWNSTTLQKPFHRLLGIYLLFIDQNQKPDFSNPSHVNLLFSTLFPVYLFDYPLFQKITSQFSREANDFFHRHQWVGLLMHIFTNHRFTNGINFKNYWQEIERHPSHNGLLKILKLFIHSYEHAKKPGTLTAFNIEFILELILFIRGTYNLYFYSNKPSTPWINLLNLASLEHVVFGLFSYILLVYRKEFPWTTHKEKFFWKICLGFAIFLWPAADLSIPTQINMKNLLPEFFSSKINSRLTYQIIFTITTISLFIISHLIAFLYYLFQPPIFNLYHTYRKYLAIKNDPYLQKLIS